MKRKLTYKEVQDVITQEDMCGVQNLIQEIFACVPLGTDKVMLDKDFEVIGEFDEQGLLGDVEVIQLKEK